MCSPASPAVLLRTTSFLVQVGDLARLRLDRHLLAGADDPPEAIPACGRSVAAGSDHVEQEEDEQGEHRGHKQAAQAA